MFVFVSCCHIYIFLLFKKKTSDFVCLFFIFFHAFFCLFFTLFLFVFHAFFHVFFCFCNDFFLLSRVFLFFVFYCFAVFMLRERTGESPVQRLLRLREETALLAEDLEEMSKVGRSRPRILLFFWLVVGLP